MSLISRRLVALLTFTIGLVAVWFLQTPAALPGNFRVVIPPIPVPLTREEMIALPHSCGIFVVSVGKDRSLKLNMDEMGSVERPEAMIVTLSSIFQERAVNRAYAQDMEYCPDLPQPKRILRTVVVKSHLSVAYGDVVKVIDAVKGAGASPVVLQLDELPQ